MASDLVVIEAVFAPQRVVSNPLIEVTLRGPRTWPLVLLKRALSEQAVPTRVLRGPFRGAVIVLNRRDSLRKIFGFYECEHACWLVSELGSN